MGTFVVSNFKRPSEIVIFLLHYQVVYQLNSVQNAKSTTAKVTVACYSASRLRHIQFIKMYCFPMEKCLLHQPSLEEIAHVLQKPLQANFVTAEVEVVDCPDLTQEPFFLAAPGLGGNPCILDVGGVPNLVPSVRKDKNYNLDKLAEFINRPGVYMMGAGAGPYSHVGCNCELIANMKSSIGAEKGFSKSYTVKVNPEDGSYVMDPLRTSDFSLMANLLACDGDSGRVLKIRAVKRTGSNSSFSEVIRTALKAYYDKLVVALGGAFVVQKGRAKIHVMPEFSPVPLNSEDEVNEWLKYYDMEAPLVCVGTLVSYDPGLDLRKEHFHCFGKNGQGGHYHYDTTPDVVEYVGYFTPGEMLYRVDRPVPKS